MSSSLSRVFISNLLYDTHHAQYIIQGTSDGSSSHKVKDPYAAPYCQGLWHSHSISMESTQTQGNRLLRTRKRRPNRRSRRSGVKIRAARQAFILQQLKETLTQPEPQSGTSSPPPTLSPGTPHSVDSDASTIDLDHNIEPPSEAPTLIECITLSDDEEESIIDTNTTAKVNNHEEIPTHLLVDYVNNYDRIQENPGIIPLTIADWCQ